MTDPVLATLGAEIERLRDRLRAGTVRRAAVLLFEQPEDGGDIRVYLSLKAFSKDDAKAFLSAGLLRAFVEGGLATQEEIDET